jgi:predicted transcriptional regulator
MPIITQETIEMNQTECSQCCGSGRVFQPDVDLMMKHWREKLGVTRKMVAALAKIPYTTYCKFENGSVTFGEARLRKLVELMRIVEAENLVELMRIVEAENNVTPSR